MTAIVLDGTAVRDEIFADLTQRVQALTAAGRTPGSPMRNRRNGMGPGRYSTASSCVGSGSSPCSFRHRVVKLIPSWNDFIPIFKSPAHNTVDGVHYGVSLQWGPNVLLYNHSKLKPGPTDWNALYDPKYKGQITVPNNPIQIADAAFYLMHSKPSLGIKDPYELSKTQFDATVNLLKQQRKLVKLYWNYDTDGRTAFANGDVNLGAIWPVDTLALQAKKVPVTEVIPKDGATGWADTWMLAKKAPHPNCAYLWMKYATTPPVQAQQALVFGETPVNPKACPFMDKIQAGSCAKYHLNEPLDYYNTIRFWKTPIADCGNGKNDCMDYNAWQKAWTEITG